MITRIKVDGFKSLVNVDVELGPFTCIAGSNAVGKSNFFDALIFLSNLADKTLVDAAKSVRSDDKKYSTLKDIFHKSGNKYANTMKFEVYMIIPIKGEDDLGQQATASITSVKYVLALRYNGSEEDGPMMIEREELVPIPLEEARKSIKFKATKDWKTEVIRGRKTTSFISTDGEYIKIHGDGKKGRATSFIASKMPRTLLSTIQAEYLTAFMVRHEFRSWRMLQLEPSALRMPDDFDARRNVQLSTNGAHLAATLYRLQVENPDRDVYQEATNNLSQIIEDIDYVSVDKDEKRELLTLQVRYKGGSIFPANTLSDGTLRFLGLTVLKMDDKTEGVICFEEPENGIHPLKISAIIDLLQQIAVSTSYSIDEDNPFRQVVINTHSPLVVSIVPEDSLLMAEFQESYDEEKKVFFQHTVFKGLSDTWRSKDNPRNSVSKGTLLRYLNPVEYHVEEPHQLSPTKRVIDRSEVYGVQTKMFS